MRKSVCLSKETYSYLEKGQGETILFLHGNMSSSVHMESLMDKLSSTYHCIAPDLRGFGESSYNNRYDTFHELADDVLAFLDSLNISSVYAVGWSAGFAVALSLAIKRPSLVKGIFSLQGFSVLGYPIFRKDEQFKPIIGAKYATKEELALDPVQVAPAELMLKTNNRDGMKAVWDMLIYTGKNKPSEEESEKLLTATMKQRCLVDLDWALANFNLVENREIDKINCKIMLTMADKDLTVPTWMVEQNITNLGDKCSVIAYPDCGHSILIDDLDKLAKDIGDAYEKQN